MAYDNEVGSTTKVTIDNKRTQYTYVLGNTVAASGSEEFRLPADAVKGKIVEIYFESASEDCDIFISESDDGVATALETILYLQNINLGYSPELAVPRYYYNRDDAAYLYLTVTNASGSTTTGTGATLKLTYERY